MCRCPYSPRVQVHTIHDAAGLTKKSTIFVCNVFEPEGIPTPSLYQDPIANLPTSLSSHVPHNALGAVADTFPAVVPGTPPRCQSSPHGLLNSLVEVLQHPALRSARRNSEDRHTRASPKAKTTPSMTIVPISIADGHD